MASAKAKALPEFHGLKVYFFTFNGLSLVPGAARK
jgi:hypothetical protein